jgi:hypothetical protein
MQDDTLNEEINSKPTDATETSTIETTQPELTTAEPTEAELPKKNIKKKRIIIGSILVSALIIGSGSALAYNLWYQNPEKIVTDALVSAFKADTLQVAGSFEAKNEEFNVKVQIDAKAASKNGEAAAKIEFKSGEQTMKLDGAGYFGSEGDLYLKVNNAKDIINVVTGDMAKATTAFDALSEKVSGKWIKITSKDIGEVNEDYKKSQVCIEDVIKQVNEDKSLSNEVTKLYKNNRFIVINEKLGSKTINGVGSLGYVVDIDDDKAKFFVTGLETTEIGKKFKACDETIDFKEIANALNSTEEDSTAGEGKVQLWASRFGHQITEVRAKGNADSTQINTVLNPVFNKPLNLKAPTSSITLESLKAEFDAAVEAYTSELYAEAYAQV